MDHRNRIVERFEADDTAIGARATVVSPTLVEVYGSIGLDFTWIDLEHTGPAPTDSPAIEELTRSAEVGGIDLLVRIPASDPHVVRKLLDAGVRNVLIPRVETAAEVESIVAASRFVYDGAPGERGNAAGRSAVWGSASENYVEREDKSTCVGVMIENETAVENVEEILSVPDLGFVFVGPSDLSVSLGCPLETDHPDVRSAIESIRTAALDADVPVGCIANDPASASVAIEEGYQLLRIGDEVSAARTILGERVASIRTDGTGTVTDER